MNVNCVRFDPQNHITSPYFCFKSSSMNEVVHTSPTIGSNVEEIVVNNTHFLMWDIGGQESLRSSWNTYYTNTEVIAFSKIKLIYVQIPHAFSVCCQKAKKIIICRSDIPLYYLSLVCHCGGGQHRPRTDLCDQRGALSNAST